MGGCRNYAGSTGDGLSFGDVTFMDGATAASWCGWQNHSSIANLKGAFINKGVFSNGSFYQYFESGKQIMYVRSPADVKSIYQSVLSTATLYSTGVWYFMTMTWSPGPTWQLFVNGSSKSLAVFTAGNPTSIANSTPALETGSFDGGSPAMQGKMAYNTIFNAVLTDAQISELMRNPFAVFSSTQFMAPNWNPSAVNEIDIVRGTSGTPTNAAESFDGPPIGMLYAALCQ